jgi:cell division protein FtsW
MARPNSGVMRPPDLVLFLATLGLLGVGLVMVFSASAVKALLGPQGDPTHFLKRQLVWTAIGIVCMILTLKIDYRVWRRLSVPILLVSIGLLAVVLVPGVADEISGAKRWIRFGFIGVQPSEVAKFAIVLFLASYLAGRRTRIGIPELVLPCTILGLMALLMLKEPDLGTTIVMTGGVCIMLFVGGIPISYMVALACTGVSAFLYLALSADYRRERLMAFMDPWSDPLDKGFHIIQSLLALGSGGLFGLGLGQSRQKYFYLPAQHTDFIFSVLGEELGFIGSLTVMILFFLFAWRGYRIAITSQDIFGSLLAVGLTSMTLLQMLVNVAVVSGLMPVTGIALPFISFGGSSLVISLVGVGVLLNISTRANT